MKSVLSARGVALLILVVPQASSFTLNTNNNNNKNSGINNAANEHQQAPAEEIFDAAAAAVSSTGRRSFVSSVAGILTSAAVAATTVTCGDSNNNKAFAFDGSGSSAYSGYNPATKAEMKKTYKARIAADVRDFNALGDAISRGETSGGAWTNFFIQFARREPDPVGRTYAALVDLRGLPINKKEFEGGDGMLLANTFTKAGKPPDNTPAVQSFKKVIRAFDPIEEAGKKSDVAKAKVEYEKAKALLSAYLADVEMPSDLSDPLYQ